MLLSGFKRKKKGARYNSQEGEKSFGLFELSGQKQSSARWMVWPGAEGCWVMSLNFHL